MNEAKKGGPVSGNSQVVTMTSVCFMHFNPTNALGNGRLVVCACTATTVIHNICFIVRSTGFRDEDFMVGSVAEVNLKIHCICAHHSPD